MNTKLFNTNYSMLLKKALNVYGKQHRAIAQNVANANNSDYKRINTNFSQMLKIAEDQSHLKVSDKRHLGTFNLIDSGSNSGENSDGEKVDLTQEMTELAENQIKHEFVSRILYRYYNGLSTSIVGRNR